MNPRTIQHATRPPNAPVRTSDCRLKGVPQKAGCVSDKSTLEPEEVLAVLLKDRSTGRNLVWTTDDYAARGKGFCADDEMQVGQIANKEHHVIRSRVDTGEPVEFRSMAENGGGHG